MDRKSCLNSPKLHFARLSSQGVFGQQQKGESDIRVPGKWATRKTVYFLEPLRKNVYKPVHVGRKVKVPVPTDNYLLYK